MDTILGHISALIAALVLALPPGVCCFGGVGAAEKASPLKSCCQKTAASSPAQHTAPQCPHGGCCCERHMVSPPNVVQLPDLHSHGILVAMATMPLAEVQLSAAPAAAVLPTGPPLHVLHCVWLI